MVNLNYIGISVLTVTGDEPAMSDIFWDATHNIIYTSGGAFGTFTSWTWSGSAFAAEILPDIFSGPIESSGADISGFQMSGVFYVSVNGGAVSGVEVFAADGDGLGAVTDIGASFASVDHLAWIGQFQDCLVVTASGEGGDLTLWSVDTGGDRREVGQVTHGDAGERSGVGDLEHFQQGGEDYIVSVDLYGNSIMVCRVSSDGLLRTDQLDVTDGFAVHQPTHVQSVEFGGQTFLIVAGAGCNSITVFSVEDGVLALRDHVLDDLNTRFDNIAVLETIEHEGRVFVAASGADSGLTVFTLLPDGRLISVATREDRVGTPLEDIAALEFIVQDGGLHLLASGEGWTGLSLIEVETGELGKVRTGGSLANTITGGADNDMLSGGGGDDVLIGGDGDDILIDGAGLDEMFGGDGADSFILSLDGDRDTISDFELGVDQIDLSLFGRAYSLDSLTFTTLPNGVRIEFNDEVLDVFTSNGESLSSSDFTYQSLFGVAHIALEELPEIDDDTEDLPPDDDETPSVDLSEGDYQIGTAGDDLILSGLENDLFDMASAQVVRLFQAILGRVPGQDGHLIWTEAIESGDLSGQAVAFSLMQSVEFTRQYGGADDTEFITLLFQNVLGRAPSEAGFNIWVDNLQNGMTRQEVVWGFSESSEFQNIMLHTTLDFNAATYQASWSDDASVLER